MGDEGYLDTFRDLGAAFIAALVLIFFLLVVSIRVLVLVV